MRCRILSVTFDTRSQPVKTDLIRMKRMTKASRLLQRMHCRLPAPVAVVAVDGGRATRFEPDWRLRVTVECR